MSWLRFFFSWSLRRSKKWLSIMTMPFAAISLPTSPSCKARLTALVVALSSVLRSDLGMHCFPRPSKPINSPARAHRCLHLGDFSSAPLITAIAHCSFARPRCAESTPGRGSASSCWTNCILALLKTERIRIVVRRPSGRCHIRGAERS